MNEFILYALKRNKFGILIFYLFFSFAFNSHAQIITTIAGTGDEGFSGEGGPAINAHFNSPCSVGTDRLGNVYIADWENDVIQKIDNAGTITRFAGNGTTGYSGDGGQATAAQIGLYSIVGITEDTAGNIFFTDGSAVRKVNTFGIISTVVGTQVFGSSGDGGPATAAQVKATTGICFDKAGNFYIADEQDCRIRKVNSMGIISTIAGTTPTAGYSGDGGPATDAGLNGPGGIAIDDGGNIFFADYAGVRKIDASGIISTIAGFTPMSMVTFCEGCSARSIQISPIGIALDHAGNVYASDIVNALVQKITKDGLVYTVVGNGGRGYNGDGIPATTAELYAPEMICFDNDYNLLIADKNNQRIRKVMGGITAVQQASAVSPQLSVYPNPVTNGQFSCTLTTGISEETSIVISDVLGRVAYMAAIRTNTPLPISLKTPPGLYFITATTVSSKVSAKFSME